MSKLEDSKPNIVKLANLSIEANRYYSYSILDYQTSYAEGQVKLSFPIALEQMTQYAKQQKMNEHHAEIEDSQSKFVWKNPESIITVVLKEAKFQSTNMVIQQTQRHPPKTQVNEAKSNI